MADARTIIDLGARFVAYGSEFSGIYQHLAACSAEFDDLGVQAMSRQSTESRSY